MKLTKNKCDVVVIGLGYIGLPTAALISSRGYQVYGVDVNSAVIKSLQKGEIHIVEPDLNEIVQESIQKGLFQFGTKPIVSDTYLIVEPTPFKENNEPDISYILKATEGIIPFLKEGDLYIIESTSPIGTTEKMRDYIFSKRPELKNKIHIAYCPERVLPGNVMHELVHNDRVIGGVDEASTQKAIEFYECFVSSNLHATNSRTAEMCKLVENSSRDAQIAFANELSIICDKANIDVWELIKLANKHPRVNILNPGSGVGGHCIAVDPYFISTQYPMESKIINASREVNNYKAFWCAEKIQNAVLKFEINNGRKPLVALLGLAFKPNIDDLRESPAHYIVKKVIQNIGNEYIYVVEPNIDKHPEFSLSSIEEVENKVDILVYLVAHDEFKVLKSSKNQESMDFCGVTK